MNENVEENKNLNDKQKQALSLLLLGKTNEDVAKELKINGNTIYRWRKQESFKTALKNKQEAVIEELISKIQPLGNKAIDVLESLLNNASNENNKLKASIFIIEKLLQLKDDYLLQKIEEIEIILKSKGY